MRFLIIGLTMILTACGGGGGNGGSTTPTAVTYQRVINQNTAEFNVVSNYTIGDLNGDGLDDVIIGGWTSRETSYFAILIQNPDGTLTERTQELVGTNQYQGGNHKILGDFDHDGYQDIWMPGFNDFCNGCTANSLMLWGSASGKFTKQTFDLGINSHGACLADMSNDGNIDLLVRGQYHSDGDLSYGYYLNNGNRTFTFVAARYANGAQTCAVIKDPTTHHAAILQGSNAADNHVPGYNSSINILDANLNLIKQIGVASQNPNDTDLVYSIALDVNGDVLQDFVLVFGGRKEIWLNRGNDDFSYAYTLDSTRMNAGDPQSFSYDNIKYYFFNGPEGAATLYQFINNQFVEYKRDSLLNMATALGGHVNANDWSIRAASVYRGSSGLYMLQDINGVKYTQKM